MDTRSWDVELSPTRMRKRRMSTTTSPGPDFSVTVTTSSGQEFRATTTRRMATKATSSAPELSMLKTSESRATPTRSTPGLEFSPSRRATTSTPASSPLATRRRLTRMKCSSATYMPRLWRWRKVACSWMFTKNHRSATTTASRRSRAAMMGMARTTAATGMIRGTTGMSRMMIAMMRSTSC
uniref:Uncharacterized protein n=1 Tax=Triticum urartu TaxID=4572 RepID=A0A8R7PEI1_TRIUA